MTNKKTKHARRGRPWKSGNGPMAIRAAVRMTWDQEQQIDAMRERLGLDTIADTIRFMCDYFCNSCSCRDEAQTDMAALREKNEELLAELISWRDRYVQQEKQAIIEKYKETG